MKVKFYSASACLQIFMTLRALFPWNWTLARRHNLTFQKGRVPVFKGLNIDSDWWLTDISFAKTDLTKEFPQDLMCEGRANSPPLSAGCAAENVWQAAINLLCSLAGSFCLPSCQDPVTPLTVPLSRTVWRLYRHGISWTLYLLNL